MYRVVIERKTAQTSEKVVCATQMTKGEAIVMASHLADAIAISLNTDGEMTGQLKRSYSGNNFQIVIGVYPDYKEVVL